MKAYIVHDSPLGTDYSGAGMYALITEKEETLELGFPKPQGWGNKDISNGMSIALYNDDTEDFNYSIGELIEFLPTSFSKKDKYFRLDIFPARSGWFILYATYNKEEYHRNFKRELIDALFCACVTLKEEGVIWQKRKHITR